MNESVDGSDGDGAREMCVCNRQREIGVAPGNYRSENQPKVTSAGEVVSGILSCRAKDVCTVYIMHVQYTQGPSDLWEEKGGPEEDGDRGRVEEIEQLRMAMEGRRGLAQERKASGMSWTSSHPLTT